MSDQYIIDGYDHPRSDVFYAVTRVPGKNAADILFEKFEFGCGDVECADRCSCLKSGTNYKRVGEVLLLNEAKFGDVPVFECSTRCECFANVIRYWNGSRFNSRLCGNRCVQFGPAAGLEVFDTQKKGLGLKTTQPIPSGGFICEYAGEVIGLDEARDRQRRNTNGNYIFVLTENFGGGSQTTCVDPTVIGNIGRYINHACQPNAEVVPVRIENMVPLLCVFAVRDIAEGEEICFDYSGGGESDGAVDRKPCFCGAENCKKLLPYQMSW